MLATIAMVAALQLSDLSFQQLESYYWDCDAAFMKGEMGGQDFNSCLSVTDEFQGRFRDKASFTAYWNQNKSQQWRKRGYQHEADKAQSR